MTFILSSLSFFELMSRYRCTAYSHSWARCLSVEFPLNLKGFPMSIVSLVDDMIACTVAGFFRPWMMLCLAKIRRTDSVNFFGGGPVVCPGWFTNVCCPVVVDCPVVTLDGPACCLAVCSCDVLLDSAGECVLDGLLDPVLDPCLDSCNTAAVR